MRLPLQHSCSRSGTHFVTGLVLPVLAIQIVIALCVTSACGGNRPALAPFIAGIVTRSADLTFVTEQDSEVFAFYRNTEVKDLSDDCFLSLIRRPPGVRVVRIPWQDFFRFRKQTDPAGNWRNLQEYLEANLINVTVIRVPRDAPYDTQYDLYAVGIFDGGKVVGVQMFGVGT